MSTKLETVKDMATAVNGLIENSQSVYEKCIQGLGEDYGMYQVLALLRLAKEELQTTIEYLSH